MKKSYYDCHKADSHFDGKCHYSESNDNCEHCWASDIYNNEDVILDDRGRKYKKCICCGGRGLQEIK